MRPTTAIILLSGALGIVTALNSAPANPAAGQRVPVLLELFTSEGCSSCPPADDLLKKLDRDQPVRGAETIVVSEHVDYWNHLGWSDPYSSHLYSTRQEEYARRLGSGDVYTPQIVVDGRAEVLGSDYSAVARAVSHAIEALKIPVTVSGTRAGGSGTVTIGAPASDRGAREIDVYLVLAADRAAAQVSRGENAGRALSHVAVAWSFEKVAAWNAATELRQDVRINLKAAPREGETRAIAILRDRRSGQVLGLSKTRL